MYLLVEIVLYAESNELQMVSNALITYKQMSRVVFIYSEAFTKVLKVVFVFASRFSVAIIIPLKRNVLTI